MIPKTKRLLSAVVPLVFWASLAAQTPPVHPDVKTGLWETTVTTKTSGMPPISDQTLAKMTPEQRAQMMAMLNGTRTTKVCITQEKLDKGMDFGGESRPNCKQNIVKYTAHEVEMTEECADARGTRSIKGSYQITSRESANGTMHIETVRADKTSVIDGTIQSKWISDTCGEVQ